MATVRTRQRLRTSLQAAEAELISRSPKSGDGSQATARWRQAHSWEGTGSTCPFPLQPQAAAPHRLHTACSACEPTCLCLPLQGPLRVRPAGSATATLPRGGDGTAQHLPSPQSQSASVEQSGDLISRDPAAIPAATGQVSGVSGGGAGAKQQGAGAGGTRGGGGGRGKWSGAVLCLASSRPDGLWAELHASSTSTMGPGSHAVMSQVQETRHQKLIRPKPGKSPFEQGKIIYKESWNTTSKTQGVLHVG